MQLRRFPSRPKGPSIAIGPAIAQPATVPTSRVQIAHSQATSVDRQRTAAAVTVTLARQRRAAHACGAPWEPTVRAADRSRRFRWQQDISCERVSPLAAQFGWCPLPHVTCEPECVKAADQQVAGIQSAIQCSVAGRREVRVVAVVPALPNATIAMAQLLRLWFRVPWCPCRIDADCHCGTRAERLDYPAAGRARRDHGAASGGLRRRPLGMRPRLRPGVRCARWDEHTACRSLRLRDFTLMRLDQTQSHVRLSCDADDGVAYDA